MWKIVLPVFVAVLPVFAVGLGGIVGGWSEADINDPEVQNALKFAVGKHNNGSNDAYLHGVAEVVKARTQVVSGANYEITVKMAKTPCRKGSGNDNCDVHTDPDLAQPYQCTFTVWSRPWLNDIQLTKEKC